MIATWATANQGNFAHPGRFRLPAPDLSWLAFIFME